MKRSIYFQFLTLWLCLTSSVLAQIGLNGPAHPSAVLDLKSSTNDKAFYPPRLTTAQRLAIVDPQVGALVFDLNKVTLFLFDGQKWMPLATTSSDRLPPLDRVTDDGMPGDLFGASVYIQGDYAIIGAYGDDVNSIADQGSAYIFVRDGTTWTQQAKLIANDGAPSDLFGISVSMSGNYAIVGAYNDDINSNNNQGSAYIFVRDGTTWTQQAKLIANDGAAGNLFGASVSISGEYAVAGAYLSSVGTNAQQGSAYIFVRDGTTWTQQAKLIANDGTANDAFGNSVSISGDYVLIGASSDDIRSTTNSFGNDGSAYVFVRNNTTWTQQAKLIVEGFETQYFGNSVSISGADAIIGSYLSQGDSGGPQGSAYVFVRNGMTWTRQAKLIARNAAKNDNFGISVSISGNYVIVGANGSDIGTNTDQGSAYVFVRNGAVWSQVRQVVDTSPSDAYNGMSVGISNGSFIIGGMGFQSLKGKISFGTID